MSWRNCSGAKNFQKALAHKFYEWNREDVQERPSSFSNYFLEIGLGQEFTPWQSTQKKNQKFSLT